MPPVSPLFPVYDPIAAITERVRADLVARGVIGAGDAAKRVKYGASLNYRQDDAPRVYFDLAPTFTVGPPGAGRTNVGGGLTEQITEHTYPVDISTRSLFSVQDQFSVSIYARVPESGEEDVELRGDEPARLARLAGFELRARVLAAIEHVAKRAVVVLSGQWVEPKDDEFKYGTAIEMIIGLFTEVPDDVSISAPANTFEATMSQQLPNGPVHIGGIVIVNNP